MVSKSRLHSSTQLPCACRCGHPSGTTGPGSAAAPAAWQRATCSCPACCNRLAPARLCMPLLSVRPTPWLRQVATHRAAAATCHCCHLGTASRHLAPGAQHMAASALIMSMCTRTSSPCSWRTRVAHHCRLASQALLADRSSVRHNRSYVPAESTMGSSGLLHMACCRWCRQSTPLWCTQPTPSPRSGARCLGSWWWGWERR